MTLKQGMRQKSRFRAVLDDHTEVAVVLPRGTVLRDGDKLAADDGSVGWCTRRRSSFRPR